MVDRCKKEIVAVDLDGTLYNGSSLKRFFSFGLYYALKRCDIMTVFIILYNVVMERIGVIEHRKMKYHVVSRLEKIIPETAMKKFVQVLKSKLNREVIELISRKQRNGAIIVLTTASPTSYSRLLADKLNFNEVCSTMTTSDMNDYVENRGSEKVSAIEELIRLYNGRLTTVITDHSDDIPLLQFNAEGDNILVNPRNGETEKIKNAGIRFVMIH